MSLLIIYIIAMTSYLAAAGLQGLALSGRGQVARLSWMWLAFFAITLHGFILYRSIDGIAGQNLTYVNVLSLITWCVAIIIVVISFFRPMANLSIFVFPLACASILFIIAFPGMRIESTAQSPSRFIHIWLAVLALSVLCVAAIQAVLLSIQVRCLRLKYVGALLRSLPPLETMEKLLFQIITVGFVLLSAMLLSSVFFINKILTSPFLHQILLSVLAWFVFAVLLWGRYYRGWRGRFSIFWTIVGAALLGFAYFGTAVVEKII